MSTLATGILGILAFFILIIIGMPIAFSMISVGVVGISLMRTTDAALQVMTDSFVSNFTSYTMGIVPMFVLMGELASQSGLGSSLFDTAQKFVGHRRGGLAVAVQFVCAIFGAICGSLPATTAMMGGVAYPQMKKHGYSPLLNTGCITAGSALAILIPPSLTFIVYGIATEVSIGKLFMSGVTVGILLMLCYIVTVLVWTKIKPELAPVVEKASRQEKMKALREGGLIEIAIVFAISMGGLFAGKFTPTEAGAVGTVGMLAVALIFKRFSMQVLKTAVQNTISLACIIYMMMASASILGKFIAMAGIPGILGRWVVSMDAPPFVMILLITFIYLILGCILDAVPMMLITLPIFFPIVTGTLGYDGVWFGAYSILVAALGSMTPPMGFACFVMQSTVKEVPLTTVFKGVVPFIIACVVCMVLISIFPAFATWLPSVMYGA